MLLFSCPCDSFHLFAKTASWSGFYVYMLYMVLGTESKGLEHTSWSSFYVYDVLYVVLGTEPKDLEHAR